MSEKEKANQPTQAAGDAIPAIYSAINEGIICNRYFYGGLFRPIMDAIFRELQNGFVGYFESCDENVSVAIAEGLRAQIHDLVFELEGEPDGEAKARKAAREATEEKIERVREAIASAYWGDDCTELEAEIHERTAEAIEEICRICTEAAIKAAAND